MSDDQLALYGTAEAVAEERHLAAGPLTAIYSAGALRSISLRGIEVLRGIYFLIRDRNWATAVPEIRDLAIEEGPGRFALSFAAHCRTLADDQRLVWHGRITGSAAEGIAFEAEATPEADLLTRRTGFIVLHPLERVVGARVAVEHVDGRRVETTFPDLVDPLQSFFDVRAMTHEPIPGIRATCRMEGGGWETEDHRNWMDASFKTYFRALALPHPYVVKAGETIRQRVTLRFEPSVAALPAWTPPAETVVAVGDRTGAAMPALALQAEPADLAEGTAAADRLRGLGAQRLAFRFRSDARDLPGLLRSVAGLAARLGAAPCLELAVAARGSLAEELDLVRIAADAAGLVPASLLVTTEADLGAYPPSVDRPPSPPLADLYHAARAAFPGVALGGGMFHFFTELNRRRPPRGLLDFVQHATAANVHAADDRSVMETLETLPHILRSVRAFAGGAAHRIGPAHIGMAANPYGDATSPNPERGRRTMVTDDPRHRALFGAAYAAGYLARAAQGGAEQVTMGAVGGPFGLLAGERESPTFAVLAGFAALAGAAVLQTASSDPRRVLAVAAEAPSGRSLWLANLTPAARTVRLAGLEPAGLSVLDAGTGGGFAARPLPATGSLALPPYAVGRVSW